MSAATRPIKPAELARVKPADLTRAQYAMKCEGTCMAPTIPDGARVLVDPTLPVRAGDLVVLWLKQPLAEQANHPALVKRLVMNVPPWVTSFPFQDGPRSDIRAIVIVQEDNSRRQYRFFCSDILALHHCIGPLPADYQTTPMQLKRPRARRRGALMES